MQNKTTRLMKGIVPAFALAAAACTTTGPQTIRTSDLNTNTCQTSLVERTGNNVKVIPTGQDAACAEQKRMEAIRNVEEGQFNVAAQLMEDAWDMSTATERLRDLNPLIIQWAQDEDPLLATLFKEFADKYDIDVEVVESNCVTVEGRGLLCGDANQSAQDRPTPSKGMRPGGA